MKFFREGRPQEDEMAIKGDRIYVITDEGAEAYEISLSADGTLGIRGSSCRIQGVPHTGRLTISPLVSGCILVGLSTYQ